MQTRRLLSDMRAGRPPSPDDLTAFASGLATGQVSDAQAGAFAMAACVHGLGKGGAVALTRAMRDSGDRLAWDVPGPVVDKHSTGGVGDPVSLVLAPALAALGCFVPMISGRGLGHSGGTLDKLDSIPGVRCDLAEDRFRDIVTRAGCAIVAATDRIAPADRRLYAIRDVTGTVDSIDLITASILSKKLAGGIGALVMDVKCGSGAFMSSRGDARALADMLVRTANGAGCRTSALVTAMDQPLAPALGNALEVAAIMTALEGDTDTDTATGTGTHTHTDAGTDSDLMQVTAALGGEALRLAGVADCADSGALQLIKTCRSGHAMERFERMIAAMGGPSDFATRWRDHLPTAPVTRDVPAPRGGHIAAIDGVALGMAVVQLGGGRQAETDRIDPAVGLNAVVRLGRTVAPGDPLARVHANDAEAADRAVRQVAQAIAIGPDVPHAPLILERIA